jgi:hypothetical protein
MLATIDKKSIEINLANILYTIIPYIIWTVYSSTFIKAIMGWLVSGNWTGAYLCLIKLSGSTIYKNEPLKQRQL